MRCTVIDFCEHIAIVLFDVIDAAGVGGFPRSNRQGEDHLAWRNQQASVSSRGRFFRIP